MLEIMYYFSQEVMEWMYKSSNFLTFPGDLFEGIVEGGFSYGLGLGLGLFGPWSRVECHFTLIWDLVFLH